MILICDRIHQYVPSGHVLECARCGSRILPCPHVFGDERCGYDGDAFDACDKTPEDCRERGQLERYGGYPLPNRTGEVGW